MEPVAPLVLAPREDGPPKPDGSPTTALCLPGREPAKLRQVFAFCARGPFNSLQPSLIKGWFSGTRPRAMPPIPGCLRPGGLGLPPVFDFEIVEKNGAGCKLVLPGRALADTGPKPYEPASGLIIAATFSLNRVSRTDFLARPTLSLLIWPSASSHPKASLPRQP